MSNGVNNPIPVSITVNPDGTITLSQDPVSVPLLTGRPSKITWTISGGTFQDPGIVLKNPPAGPPYPPPFIEGQPKKETSTSYSVIDLNNDRNLLPRKHPYTVNYVVNGQKKSLDPDILNQPPSGTPHGGRHKE